MSLMADPGCVKAATRFKVVTAVAFIVLGRYRVYLPFQSIIWQCQTGPPDSRGAVDIGFVNVGAISQEKLNFYSDLLIRKKNGELTDPLNFFFLFSHVFTQKIFVVVINLFVIDTGMSFFALMSPQNVILVKLLIIS